MITLLMITILNNLFFILEEHNINNDLYSKLFKKPMLEKNSEEICIVYRVLFALFGE